MTALLIETRSAGSTSGTAGSRRQAASDISAWRQYHRRAARSAEPRHDEARELLVEIADDRGACRPVEHAAQQPACEPRRGASARSARHERLWIAPSIRRQAGAARLPPWRSPSARGKDAVVALGFAAALRRRLAEPRLHQAAPLEPRQRRVDGADRDFASGVLGQLAPDRHAVGVVAEPQDREQEKVFEASEMVAHSLILLCSKNCRRCQLQPSYFCLLNSTFTSAFRIQTSNFPPAHVVRQDELWRFVRGLLRRRALMPGRDDR